MCSKCRSKSNFKQSKSQLKIKTRKLFKRTIKLDRTVEVVEVTGGGGGGSCGDNGGGGGG